MPPWTSDRSEESERSQDIQVQKQCQKALGVGVLCRGEVIVPKELGAGGEQQGEVDRGLLKDVVVVVVVVVVVDVDVDVVVVGVGHSEDGPPEVGGSLVRDDMEHSLLEGLQKESEASCKAEHKTVDA